MANIIPVYANTSFVEEFSNGFDHPDVWEMNELHGQVIFENGLIKFSSTSDNGFPYVNSVNSIGENVSGLEVKFKFDSSGPHFGSGIAFTDNVPPYNTQMDFPDDFVEYTMFYIWQDPNPLFNLHIGTSLCETNSSSCSSGITFFYTTPTQDFDWHIARIVNVDGAYEFYLDGVKIFTSKQTSRELTKIWLGHPMVTGTFGTWTSFFVDYIKIDSQDLPPVPLTPVVIIPGLGASWNPLAMFGNTSDSTWSLNPGADHYNNLIASLENVGYEQNENLFVFNYDWRKNLSNLAVDLNNFIQTQINLGKLTILDKVNLIGHSYGGLVSRAWGQNQGFDKTNEIVTLGSPHYGVVDAYGAWEGAQIWGESCIPKGIIEADLRRNQLDGEKLVDTVRRIFPSMKDLLPTYDYLNLDDVMVTEGNMLQQNTYLKNLNSSSLAIDSLLWANGGFGFPTREKVNIMNRNVNDTANGLWEDGKPVQSNPFGYADGDGRVLLSSAHNGFSNTPIVLADHGEIVRSLPAIKNIFTQLGLDISKVVTPDNVNLACNQVLTAILNSPGQIQVCDSQGSCDGNLGGFFDSEQKKIFFLPNPTDQNYEISVLNDGSGGNYLLELGNLVGDSSYWTGVVGELSPETPDTYSINLTESVIEVEGEDFEINNQAASLESLVPNWDSQGLFFDAIDVALTLPERIEAIQKLRELLSGLIVSYANDTEITDASISLWNFLDILAADLLGDSNTINLKALEAKFKSLVRLKQKTERTLSGNDSELSGQLYDEFYILYLLVDEKTERSSMPDLASDRIVSTKLLLETSIAVR